MTSKRESLIYLHFASFEHSRFLLSGVVESIWNTVRQEWSTAFAADAAQDKRVPMFVVVEEAHNIVPAETHSLSAEALRDQFRTIAAEGRKYGIFLIFLQTQRPDKIDPTIISECENRAVMRMGSSAVLTKTKSLLGLEDVKEVDECLNFQSGRFLLVGPWAGGQTTIGYSAMRRSVEGGRNLRDEYWALPEPPPTPAVS